MLSVPVWDWEWVAVGMPVTQHPLQRSVREELWERSLRLLLQS
jgi:hypothetical protein